MEANKSNQLKSLSVAASLVLLVALTVGPVSARWLPSAGEQQDGRQGEVVISGQDEAGQVRPMDLIMAAYLAGAQDFGQLDVDGTKDRLKRLNPALPKPTLRFG